MNFEELTQIWNSTDKSLDETIRINKSLVMKLGLSRIRSGLYEIKWTAVIHVVAGVFFFFFLNGFMFRHFGEMRFLIPALLLQAITVYSLVFEITRLSLYYTLDSSASVAEAQRKVARLRRMERIDNYSLLVIIPLFSAPLLIVVARAFAGIDLYELGASWLPRYIGGSVVVAGIIAFLLSRFPDRKLREAEEFLNELG